MKSIKAIVRENIRRHRLEARLSQQKLADRTGKSLRYINYLERNDSNVTIEVLFELAKGIGVDVATLVSDPAETKSDSNMSALGGLRLVQAFINEKMDQIQLQGTNQINKNDRSETPTSSRNRRTEQSDSDDGSPAPLLRKKQNKKKVK